jgi:hypothetical protein
VWPNQQRHAEHEDDAHQARASAAQRGRQRLKRGHR